MHFRFNKLEALQYHIIFLKYLFTLFDNMFVGNKKKVMDTLIDEFTQKKLAKSSNFFIWVYSSVLSYTFLCSWLTDMVWKGWRRPLIQGSDLKQEILKNIHLVGLFCLSLKKGIGQFLLLIPPFLLLFQQVW